MTPVPNDSGFILTNAAGRIYVECEKCHDGTNGPNNRHGAATLQAFTAGHNCQEETE
jgi:hypothetical protein